MSADEESGNVGVGGWMGGWVSGGTTLVDCDTVVRPTHQQLQRPHSVGPPHRDPADCVHPTHFDGMAANQCHDGGTLSFYAMFIRHPHWTVQDRRLDGTNKWECTCAPQVDRFTATRQNGCDWGCAHARAPALAPRHVPRVAKQTPATQGSKADSTRRSSHALVVRAAASPAPQAARTRGTRVKPRDTMGVQLPHHFARNN